MIYFFSRIKQKYIVSEGEEISRDVQWKQFINAKIDLNLYNIIISSVYYHDERIILIFKEINL